MLIEKKNIKMRITSLWSRNWTEIHSHDQDRSYDLDGFQVQKQVEVTGSLVPVE